MRFPWGLLLLLPKARRPVQTEVREIMASSTSVQKDRFDFLIEKSLVLDLKQSMDMAAFFNLVSNTMSDQLDISFSVLKKMRSPE